MCHKYQALKTKLHMNYSNLWLLWIWTGRAVCNKYKIAKATTEYINSNLTSGIINSIASLYTKQLSSVKKQ